MALLDVTDRSAPRRSRLRDALTDDQRARLDAAYDLLLAFGRRRLALDAVRAHGSPDDVETDTARGPDGHRTRS